MAGKGDNARPFSTTREERQLRDEYMNGLYSLPIFKRLYNRLLERGLIRRGGRIMRKD